MSYAQLCLSESEFELSSTMQLECYKYPAWHFILAEDSPCNIPVSTAIETTFVRLFVMAIFNHSDSIPQVAHQVLVETNDSHLGDMYASSTWQTHTFAEQGNKSAR